MPAVHIAGPDLPIFSPMPSAREQELLALRRGVVPPRSGAGVGYPDRNEPVVPAYQSPAAFRAGTDAQGRPVSMNPDAPIPAPDSTPGVDSAGRPVSTNPNAATPIAPPAAIPQITNSKIKAIDDEEEGQHQLMLNRQRRRQERDALTSKTNAERDLKNKAGAKANDEANQAQMRSARKTNPAAFEDDPDQPGRIRGKNRPISSEEYPGQEDNVMGPHRLDRVPLQPQPYQTPPPSAAPPPSLSAHPNDPPQSFRAKYEAISTMKSMGLDPSSPKDRAQYEQLKHLRGVH